MRQSIRSLPILLGLVVILSACSSKAGEIEVKDAWARPADAGGNSAVYFEIVNDGPEEFLLSASSRIAEKTEVHKTVIQGDGTAKMEQQSSVEIPRGEEVIFAPGGLHVMLIDLGESLAVGDQFDLTLNFEKMGEVTIHVPVQTP